MCLSSLLSSALGDDDDDDNNDDDTPTGDFVCDGVQKGDYCCSVSRPFALRLPTFATRVKG